MQFFKLQAELLNSAADSLDSAADFFDTETEPLSSAASSSAKSKKSKKCFVWAAYIEIEPRASKRFRIQNWIIVKAPMAAPKFPMLIVLFKAR